MRLTVAPKASRAVSMNSGVTPMAPHDTTRRWATRERKSGTSIIPTNKVGGPIMKLAR